MNNKKAIVWAFIPARGGSKGIKLKNIKNLNGKPLLQWSIDSLKRSNIFSKIIVSSDSSRILNLAKKNDVEIDIRKKPEDSDDFSMPDLPLLTFLKSCQKQELPNFIFMVQCTSPFIRPQTFKKAFNLLITKPNDTIFSARKSSYFLWLDRNKANKNVIPIGHPFKKRLGRQFLKDQQYIESGSFYGFSVNNFMRYKHRFFNEAFPCEINDFEFIDINTLDDFKYAQFISKKFIL
ncbi:MAG: acylneuraminate cytidylyltransferase family protein [Methylophilaceae bacterium]